MARGATHLTLRVECLFTRFYFSILFLMIEAKAMNATTERNSVHDGIYPATLKKINTVTTPHGERHQFIFLLDDLKTKNGCPITLMRTTSTSLAPKSHAQSIATALARSKNLSNQPIVWDIDLIDAPCFLHVENQKNKLGRSYSNIEAVLPVYAEAH